MARIVRPTSSRADPTKLGIRDDEGTALYAARDAEGVIDLSKAYPTPSAQEAQPEQRTVLKIMDEKGYQSEETLYKKEYQLRAAHKLLINGASTGQIATQLNISITEARKLKNELSARLVNEVKTLDKNKVAGQAIMFYDHIMAKSLQIIAKDEKSAKPSTRNQIEGLKVALQAQTDKQKFFVMSGFWNNPLDQGMANYDSHISGANDIREMMTGIITGDDVDVFIDEEDVEKDIEIL